MAVAKKKTKVFVRVDVRPGVHSLKVGDIEVSIKDREMYPTDDKKIIKVLETDPALTLMEFNDEDDDDDDEDDEGSADDHGENDPEK